MAAVENHSLESEQGVLGAILVNNDAFGRVQDILQPEHFAEPLHREIYTIIGQLVAAGKIATPVTIKPYIASGFDLGDGVTIGQYIARLAASATTVVNAPDYARTVRDLADGRTIVEIGKTLAETVTPDVVELAAYGVDMLDALVADRSMNAAPARMLDQSLALAVDKSATAYQNEGRLTGVPTGLRELDAKTLGGHGGHLIVLGGRPGMGKTALAVSIVRNMAKLQHKGIFFSLEMPDDELSTRMLADEMFDYGKLQYWQIKSGKFHEKYFQRIIEAAERLKGLPLKIEQQPFLTIAQIAARARQFKRRHGLDYLIIDHLGLIKASGRYAGNKVNETGETTGALKALAKELGIPIYLLAQLNRGLEQREDKRPTLSDLRHSGDIEQDADTVILLYRPAYYLENKEPKAGSAEFLIWADDMALVADRLDAIIAKQRSGPLGTVRLFCDIGCNAIRDKRGEMDDGSADVGEMTG